MCKSDIPTYTAKNVLIILSVNFENSSLYITVQNYLKFGYLWPLPKCYNFQIRNQNNIAVPYSFLT